MSLLKLPEVILLDIIQLLKPEPQPCVGPFQQWAAIVDEQISLASSRLQGLQSLATSNSYLYHLVKLALHPYKLIRGSAGITCLVNNLHTYPVLRDHIVTVFLDSVDISELHHVFRLPKIHTITVRGLKYDRSHLRSRYLQQEMTRKSCVKVLRLSHWTIVETIFIDLLSWPTSLRELWFHSPAAFWYRSADEETPMEELMLFARESLMKLEQGLYYQHSSLQKLVISRSDPQFAMPLSSNMPDVRGYPQLRSLSIDHCQAVELQETQFALMYFPRNIEEIEVCFTDGDDISVAESFEGLSPSHWLFTLLQPDVKFEYARDLKRVRVILLTRQEEVRVNPSARDEDDIASRPEFSTWNGPKPSQLIRSFLNADVSFSIFAGPRQRVRYVVEDGEGFSDAWEDEWRSLRIV